MGRSGRLRIGDTPHATSKVHVFAVVGPTDKLPLVTLGSSSDAAVRLEHHLEEQHRELLKQIGRLDKKQQHDKNKELMKMKYDFERWSAFEIIVDGKAVVRLPSALDGSLDTFTTDGAKLDITNLLEFDLVKAGYSLAIVFSGSKNMNRRELVGYSLIDETLIQEELHKSGPATCEHYMESVNLKVPIRDCDGQKILGRASIGLSLSCGFRKVD